MKVDHNSIFIPPRIIRKMNCLRVRDDLTLKNMNKTFDELSFSGGEHLFYYFSSAPAIITYLRFGSVSKSSIT